jgi:hypothetical protein
MEECLSVDEQMFPTKARHFLKQHMPNKPHKWGYTLFVMSGVSRFAYDFGIFSGSENGDLKEGEQDLGSSSNVVIRLSRNVPRNVNHKLFFDNYYTSLPLLVYLMKLGIYCNVLGVLYSRWNFIALQKVNTLQLNTVSNSSNTRIRPTHMVSEHSLL